MNPDYSNIVEQLFSTLDQILNNYIYNGYSSLVDHLKYPLGLAVTLYIMLMGISISQGWIKLSLGEFIKSAVKIGLIYWFAMNWSSFSYYAVQGVEGSAGEIGEWLVQASPISLPQFAGSGINGAMQSVLIEVTKIGAWTWGMASFSNIGPYFCALAIWTFGFASIALAITEIILAKLVLAILFATAPLFITFTLFKPTNGMFDRWLGSVLGFCLFLIFVPAAVVLSLDFMQLTLANHYADHASLMTIAGFVPICFVCILGVALILAVTGLAMQIGGAASVATGNAMLAGAVGGFIAGGITSKTTALTGGRMIGQGISHIGRGIDNVFDNKISSTSSMVMESIKTRLRRGE